MNYIKYYFVFLITGSLLIAQDAYDEKLFLPWGNGAHSIGFRESPGGQFGPMSFAVQDSLFLILDSQNEKLKLFNQQKLLQSVDLPSQNIDDFIWFSPENYFFLENNQVLSFKSQKINTIFKTASPKILITGLEPKHNELKIILNQAFSATPQEGRLLSLPEQKGIETNTNNRILVRKNDSNNISVVQNDAILFNIISNNGDLGTAQYIGSIPSGEIYIYLEKITRHIPLKIERQMILYSKTGDIKAVIQIPVVMHTYVFKEFFVDRSGNLYHLLTSENGVHIIAWYYDKFDLSNPQIYRYPQKFNRLPPGAYIQLLYTKNITAYIIII